MWSKTKKQKKQRSRSEHKLILFSIQRIKHKQTKLFFFLSVELNERASGIQWFWKEEKQKAQ